MRRLLTVALGLVLLCAVLPIYAATPDQGVKVPVAPLSTLTAKMAKMRAAGVVTEISDTSLKIERKVKDKVETMEFLLEKPLGGINVGQKVKVSYINSEDKNVATKVTVDIPRKVNKKAKNPGFKVSPAPVKR